MIRFLNTWEREGGFEAVFMYILALIFISVLKHFSTFYTFFVSQQCSKGIHSLTSAYYMEINKLFLFS